MHHSDLTYGQGPRLNDDCFVLAVQRLHSFVIGCTVTMISLK
jgi:hypothetical protein